MHNKLKEIRLHLGLTESQISSLLYISSYKYKRFEEGSLIITADVLILQSIMYDIPIDQLIFEKYSIDLILKSKSIKNVLAACKEDRISILKTNMCNYCPSDYNSLNFRVIKNILNSFQKRFSKNLYNLRSSKSFGVLEISIYLNSNVDHYFSLENGKIWPSVHDLICISSLFSVSINSMFGIKNETDT